MEENKKIPKHIRELITVAIDRMVNECGDNADKHGFFQSEEEKDLLHHIALLTSELGECVEAYRDENFSTTPGEGGIYEELADVIIRISSLMSHHRDKCPSFGKVIIEKMIYNMSRPEGHGRKRN